MNAYRLPAYIVLEIPAPVRDAIQAMRDSLAAPAPALRLPVEITVAGSSGIGPIPPGVEMNITEARLKPVLSGLRPFAARFREIRRFPNTNLFYLAPSERAPFDRVHESLKVSGISFGPSSWPYNPHCTLRGGAMTDRFSVEDIFGLSFPKQEFVIDTLSIYEFDSRTVTSRLAFQTKI